MNKRRYCSKSNIFRKRSTKKRKNMILLVSLILLLTITLGATIAFIYTQTQSVTNIFKPSNVTCEVDEEFDGEIKKNVSIRNAGDTEAYIRATIVVNWKDSSGNVSAVKPVETGNPKVDDYSLTLGDMSNWLYKDGYYYYTSPVEMNDSTDILISNCEQLKQKKGYFLSVEILAEAIQSTPSNVVKTYWDRTVNEYGIIIN